jgi:hypothetical protein
VYDEETKEWIKPSLSHDLKIWYKDSLVIQESVTVQYWTRYGKDTARVFVDHYSFLDLRNMSVYEYPSFSDTARLMRKYKLRPSENLGGGWSFFRSNVNYFSEGYLHMTDTIVENVQYKRVINKVSYNDTTGEVTRIKVGYFRCDKKGALFNLDKGFPGTHECPMVKFEFIVQPKQPWIRTEIDFIANNLSEKELSIFNVWERYARDHPVK